MEGTASSATRNGHLPCAPDQARRREELRLPVAKRRRRTVRRYSQLSCYPRRNAEALAQPASEQCSSGKRGHARCTRLDVCQLLSFLSAGPLMAISSFLRAIELAAMDAACRLLLALNSGHRGPWFHAGDRAFHGTEIDAPGGFLSFGGEQGGVASPVRNSEEATGRSWKNEYSFFHAGACHFQRGHWLGAEISNVENAGEVAYCRCRIRTDQLERRPNSGLYMEVEVRANGDNLSLAVVDAENLGGCSSSVTFSPETGSVILERTVQESPLVIEGKYIQLLPALPGRRFEGTLGLHLLKGQLAFYRRLAQRTQTNPTPALWETTGFCTDLQWAQGPRLSMCLVFRSAGAYNVRVSHVSRRPPVTTSQRTEAYRDDSWSSLLGDDDYALAMMEVI